MSGKTFQVLISAFLACGYIIFAYLIKITRNCKPIPSTDKGVNLCTKFGMKFTVIRVLICVKRRQPNGLTTDENNFKIAECIIIQVPFDS